MWEVFWNINWASLGTALGAARPWPFLRDVDSINARLAMSLRRRPQAPWAVMPLQRRRQAPWALDGACAFSIAQTMRFVWGAAAATAWGSATRRTSELSIRGKKTIALPPNLIFFPQRPKLETGSPARRRREQILYNYYDATLA